MPRARPFFTATELEDFREEGERARKRVVALEESPYRAALDADETYYDSRELRAAEAAWAEGWARGTRRKLEAATVRRESTEHA